jgi:maltokinase
MGALLHAVAPWLVTRRWFTHDIGCLRELSPAGQDVLIDNGGVALVHCVLDAVHAGGPRRSYQLLLGLRRLLPHDLLDAAIGRAAGGRYDGWWIYEATEDPELMGSMLDYLVCGGIPGRARFTRLGGLPLTSGLAPRLLGREQSNTTVVYGDRLLVKFFRQPHRGTHPEVEVLSGLTAARCGRSPRLAGWMHTDEDPADAYVLGVMEDFLPAAEDGWELGVRSALACVTGETRALPGAGTFTGEARELGAAVAEVHAAMAGVFPTVHQSSARVRTEADGMIARLREAVLTVPRLEVYAGRLTALFDDYARVAARAAGAAAQRVHGDLHLGQALRAPDGWRIIDFEGEPARPLAERTAAQPVLRDVAGMLRSFDYAARQALATVRETGPAPGPAERARQLRRAAAWTLRTRRAFCAGYAAAGGADPACHPVALRAFEADKAVYEAVYEAHHRPGRLPIPLAALQRLVAPR